MELFPFQNVNILLMFSYRRADETPARSGFKTSSWELRDGTVGHQGM
jgi:hypothetical protein